MMDEQLIAEVEQHGVIYNRQKYSINNMGGPGGGGGGVGGNGVNKYETKEEAWQIIAIKLQTDVEACKKRWKYLRERYVSQRKQGDPPVYEHLSRPYLEKMKFLDQHIQPRKSYRNVSNFLTSPNTNSSFAEYNMDSSKSNGSAKNLSFPIHQQTHSQPQSNVYQQDGAIKTENDQSFRDFAAAVASQQLHQLNSLHPQYNSTSMCHNNSSNNGNTAMPPAVDGYDQFRENDHHAHNMSSGQTGNGIASSTSSSMKSPLSSSPPLPPPTVANNISSELSDDQQFVANGSNNMKKPRVQMSGQYLDTSDSEDNTSPAPTMHHPNMMTDTHSSAHVHQSHQQQQHLQQQQQYNKMLSNVARNMTTMNHTPSSAAAAAGLFPPNNDFLLSLYQMTPGVAPQQERNLQATSASPIRSSEHLLGELVTSELLKMNKERRKTVQKRILEILFFED